MTLSIKRTLCALSAVFIMTAVQEAMAQAEVGGGLAFGSEIENVGINVNGTYMITENIAVAPGFTYFFPKGSGDFKLKWFEVNLNGHYYFDVPGVVRPYALAGLNFSFLTIPSFSFLNFESEKETITKVGLNLGGGAEFDIDAAVKPFGQLSYSVMDTYGQLVLVAGIRIPIN